MNKQLQIDSLQSGLPRPVIEAAFVIMVLSAICTYGPVNTWMSSHIPVVAGLVHTVGMVVIYYAFLRGMKGLPHPLTVLWWIAIGLNLCDFVILCLGESMAGLSAATATALPLIYIPLGAFLLVWYRGLLDDRPHPGGQSGPGPFLCDRSAGKCLGTCGHGDHHHLRGNLVRLDPETRAGLNRKLKTE